MFTNLTRLYATARDFFFLATVIDIVKWRIQSFHFSRTERSLAIRRKEEGGGGGGGGEACQLQTGRNTEALSTLMRFQNFPFSSRAGKTKETMFYTIHSTRLKTMKTTFSMPFSPGSVFCCPHLNWRCVYKTLNL